MSRYHIFSVYYKYGQADVSVYDTKDGLRFKLIDYLIDYSEDCKEFEHDLDQDELEKMSTSDLVRMTIKLGKMVLEQQCGWGIVSVIKGKDLSLP